MTGKPRARSKTALGIAGALIVVAAGLILLASESDKSSADPLRIEVFAKHYSWSFGYPTAGNAFSRSEFHVPVDHPIEFEIHSQDVLHGFWVPEWDVKVDAVPGGIEEVEVTPDTTGAYQLICSQSCGILHSEMRAKIVVEEPAQFQRWLDSLGPVPPNLQKEARLDREAQAIRESLAKGRSS